MIVSRHIDDFPGETLSVTQAGEVLGWGKNRAFAAAKRGEIPLLPSQEERNRRVPKHALKQLLETGTWEGRKPQLQVVRGNRAA